MVPGAQEVGDSVGCAVVGVLVGATVAVGTGVGATCNQSSPPTPVALCSLMPKKRLFSSAIFFNLLVTELIHVGSR